MDETILNNAVSLTGVPCGVPAFSHESRGEPFYTLPLAVERLSGYRDRLNITLREELLPAIRDTRESMLHITGELRSFNNRSGEGSKLVITVFAQRIEPPEEAVWENSVELTGTLCKPPNLRLTPREREICDLMLAVNRHYGRSDYLPCIAWGLNARRASQWAVGNRLSLRGRIQSRDYIKVLEEGCVTRTAFEVSASELCLLTE